MSAIKYGYTLQNALLSQPGKSKCRYGLSWSHQSVYTHPPNLGNLPVRATVGRSYDTKHYGLGAPLGGAKPAYKIRGVKRGFTFVLLCSCSLISKKVKCKQENKISGIQLGHAKDY